MFHFYSSIASIPWLQNLFGRCNTCITTLFIAAYKTPKINSKSPTPSSLPILPPTPTLTPSLPPILPPTPTPYLPPTIVSPQSSPPPSPIDTNVPAKPLITQVYPSSSSGGLNGGQKEGIGIAIGVIFEAKALFLGGLMYKRRRSKFLI